MEGGREVPGQTIMLSIVVLERRFKPLHNSSLSEKNIAKHPKLSISYFILYFI
jgi:hypothetical protein